MNELATVEMVIDDEMQALLLLSSLLDTWETVVVSVSNSIPDGVLSMNQVASSLTDNAHAFVTGKMERSKSRGSKEGRGRSRGGSQTRRNSEKCFHYGKEGHIKKNCFSLKEQKEANNEHKNDTNT